MNVDDIIDDIEFELMQGVLPPDDIGQGIMTLRQYQSKLRSESLSNATPKHEIFIRLFRFNDMLITLLQELAEEIHALRRDLRKFVCIERHTNMPNSGDAIPAGATILIDREVSEIRNAMRDDAIWLDLQARLVRLPVLGRLIGPLQIFLHRPGLFYARLLADRQAPINRTFGNWILDLDEVQRYHNVQITQLNTRIAELESRLNTYTQGTSVTEEKNRD